MNPMLPWDVRVTADLVLGGIGVGAFLLAVLTSVYHEGTNRLTAKIGFLVAPVAVGLGLFSILTELGQPLRFFTAFFRVNPSSVMSWGIFLQTIFLLLTILVALPIYKRGEASAPSTVKILGTVCAIAVGLYHGLLLSSNVGRPLWNDGLFPFMFFGFSVLTGFAVVLLINLAVSKTATSTVSRSEAAATQSSDNNGASLPKLLFSVLVFELVAILLWMVNTTRSGLAAEKSLQLLLSDYALAWWGGTIVLGLVFPLVLVYFGSSRRNNPPAGVLSLASAAILVGGIIFKHILLVAGQVRLPLL